MFWLTLVAFTAGAVRVSVAALQLTGHLRHAGPTLSFFNRAEAIALHRSGCTRCGSYP
jgi:hypothetical protein